MHVYGIAAHSLFVVLWRRQRQLQEELGVR
jgi:hypothetical protein